MRQQERIFSNEFFTPTFVFFSRRVFVFVFVFFFHYREERVRKRERERERERESFFFFCFFFVFEQPTFLACCRLDDVGAFVAFLPRLFFTSLSLSLSLSLSRKSDIIKQKGPKKKKRDQREMSFFFRLSFFQQTQKSTKRERGLFEPFVLSNENEGLIIINRQKHRAPLKPLEEEEEDSEDEDGTQTLLETVRVLHRALQSEWFFRFCTGALQQSRLRAARVLDRHRRIEIRELARVVRGGLSSLFFFRCRVCFSSPLSALFLLLLLCAVLRMMMMISSLFGMRS